MLWQQDSGHDFRTAGTYVEAVIVEGAPLREKRECSTCYQFRFLDYKFEISLGGSFTGPAFASGEGLPGVTTIVIFSANMLPGSSFGSTEETLLFTCTELKVLNRAVEAGYQQDRNAIAFAESATRPLFQVKLYCKKTQVRHDGKTLCESGHSDYNFGDLCEWRQGLAR